jgi:hypothetical protein
MSDSVPVFAWEDKFRSLPLRFERISHVHYAFKTLAYTMINLRLYRLGLSGHRFATQAASLRVAA